MAEDDNYMEKCPAGKADNSGGRGLSVEHNFYSDRRLLIFLECMSSDVGQQKFEGFSFFLMLHLSVVRSTDTSLMDYLMEFNGIRP